MSEEDNKQETTQEESTRPEYISEKFGIMTGER